MAHEYRLKAGVSVFDGEAVKLAAQHCDFLKLAAREQDNSPLFVACLLAQKPIYRSVSKSNKWEGWPNGTVYLRTIQRYPAPLAVSLLTLVNTARHWRKHKAPWGWSSHTSSALDCRLAAWLGASVIEKHLALTHDDLEAKHSILPEQWQNMARSINEH